MSDLDISGSDSEPVSDINPEEMARLMADIGEMDDDPFGNVKSSTKDAKDSKKHVTFSEKPKPAVNATKTNDDDDEDWDADDLLNSDLDDMPAKKPASTAAASDKSPSAAGKKPEAEKITPSKVNVNKTSPKEKLMSDLFSDDSANKAVGSSPNSRTNSKEKLMSELFNDDTAGEAKGSSNSPSATQGTARDKSKLMADLFGEGDKKAASAQQPGRGAKKTAKEEVTFDDDGDLLGGLGGTKQKGSGSSQGGSFLDSLLSKSKAVEAPKTEKPAKFVLPDTYKGQSKQDKEEKRDGLGGYMPSVEKSNSPRKRTPSKSPVRDLFDVSPGQGPRRRGARSAPQRKPFEVDDDDILGNVRTRKTPHKESPKEASPGPGRRSSSAVESRQQSAASRKEDWLFGGTGEVAAGGVVGGSPVAATIERPGDITDSGSPKKAEDWLVNMLSSSSKNTPSPHKQAQQKVISPGKTNAASGSVHDAHTSPSVNTAVVPGSVTHQSPAVYSPPQAHATGQLASPAEEVMRQQQGAQHAQASALAQQLRGQQQQMEAHMSQQLQQQQQLMGEVMRKQQEAAEKRYQDAVSALSQLSSSPTVPLTILEDKKNIEVELKRAEVEIARLTAELEVVRRQHSEEVVLLQEGYRRKMEVETEVREGVEGRLREERDSLLADFQAKVMIVQQEKESLASSYESQLAAVKCEWSQALERTKDLYTAMMERMKQEHQAALERMTSLKELELKAALSATGHVKDIEVVMTQLESNTSDLSQLTASINTRHESALHLAQRALKIKEKQLQDFEAQLSASQAESEKERARMNALIQRLETTIIQQGSEVEKEKWRLAQERLKAEVERNSLAEERKHLQLSADSDRQNLSNARDSMMAEQRSLLQSVAQQKQEIAQQQAGLSAQQQRLAAGTTTATHFMANKIGKLDIEAEMTLLTEERQRLREKLMSLTTQEHRLQEEERRLQDLKLQLEQDKAKIKLDQEACNQEKAALAKTERDSEATRQEIQALRHQQQERLSQITSQTQALHRQQEKTDKEYMKLQQLREEVVRFAQASLCPSCQLRGGAGSLVQSYVSTQRFPGDGGEGDIPLPVKAEPSARVDRSPACVLARLSAARQRENMEREKRLLEISALQSS